MRKVFRPAKKSFGVSTAVIAVTIISSPALAEDILILGTNCKPQVVSRHEPDPVIETEVNYTVNDSTGRKKIDVIHHFKSGRAVYRSDQYILRSIKAGRRSATGSLWVVWTGTLRSDPTKSIIGRLDASDGTTIFSETWFERGRFKNEEHSKCATPEAE